MMLRHADKFSTCRRGILSMCLRTAWRRVFLSTSWKLVATPEGCLELFTQKMPRFGSDGLLSIYPRRSNTEASSVSTRRASSSVVMVCSPLLSYSIAARAGLATHVRLPTFTLFFPNLVSQDRHNLTPSPIPHPPTCAPRHSAPLCSPSSRRRRSPSSRHPSRLCSPRPHAGSCRWLRPPRRGG